MNKISGPIEKQNKLRNFILGVIILLIVDLLWVGSAEASEYIFKKIKYDKPFFTTYFKTSFFIVYLFGFIFVRSWHFQCKQCIHGRNAKKLLEEVDRVSQTPCISRHFPGGSSGYSGETSRASTPVGYITPPQYENMTDDDDVSVNTTEDGDDRKVSFSKVREVRSLAQKHLDAQVLSRMSHNSVEELKNVLLNLSDKIPLYHTVKLAVYFVVLWIFATLCYQEALARTSSAVTNILSSTSGIFTLILAAIFPSTPGDRFNVSKLITVFVSFGGIFLVIWTDPSNKESIYRVNIGDFYALAGACLYACYLTLIKRKVGVDKKLDMPMFFGFVGLFGALLFWPGFFLLHYTGVERFELPSDGETWLFLIGNAVIGTVLSELLWLWGCFLTSSLMATLSLGLVIPLTMAFDMVFNHLEFSNLFFVGVIPVLVGFFVISLLTHYENLDPVKECFLKLCFSSASREDKQDEHESLLAAEERSDSVHSEHV